MDFSRKHRPHDDRLDDVLRANNLARAAVMVSTDVPLKIEPGCGPPPPEIRQMTIDGESVLVIMETGCAPPAWPKLDAWDPLSDSRSIWDVYRLRRRPRRS